MAHMYDVAIIGGGISGLYTAWRLSQTTDLRVVLMESSGRFGGRYQTVVLPGGFPADLGAMRFMPSKHPILYQLTQDMGIETEEFYIKAEMEMSAPKNYYRKQHVSTAVEMMSLFHVKDDEQRYFSQSDLLPNINVPASGDVYEARCPKTGMLAKDISASLYYSLPMNPELPSAAIASKAYPLTISMADTLAWDLPFQSNKGQSTELSGYHCIKGGMELLVKQLVKDLETNPKVKLIKSFPVASICESVGEFTIGSDAYPDISYSAQKIILACNASSAKYISWNSPFCRNTHLQRLFSRVNEANAVKLFLTYKTAWWEEAGLISGSLGTDQTIHEVTAFGSRAKSPEYATLLAAFTYCNTEIFDGLNQPCYPRYSNTAGQIPANLQPSQLLVDYVQRQLNKIFAIDSIPQPVCALVKLWRSDPIAANYETKVGEDPRVLEWRGLKPFPDADIYMTGDTFAACFDTGASLGWSEGALLNSERLVTTYFNAEPYKGALHWKKKLAKAKL